MDEFKWMWVLFVAATLALLIRLAMWIFPAPGWRSQRIADAEAATSTPVNEAAAAQAPTATVSGVETLAPVPAPSMPEPPPAPTVSPRSEPEPTAHAPAPPPPEEYHLRQTRWGMTMDEVRASELSPPLRENESFLVYSIATLDMPCLLAYSFVQDRLVRAKMAFSDPSGRDIPPLSIAQAQRRFLYLREQLRARYGEPVQKTNYLSRDVTDLRRHAEKQEELARQYDIEISDAQQRIDKQRGILETRYAQWPNRNDMIGRGLASYERDLRELRTWKLEALDGADQSRRSIQEKKEADQAKPLLATMSARWFNARGLHDIELRLDCRQSIPRLDIRYEGMPFPGGWNSRGEI